MCFCHRVTFLLQVKGTLYTRDPPVKTELMLSYIRVCFIFFQTRWKTCHNNKPLFHPGQLENYVTTEMTSFGYDTEPAPALRNLGEAVTAWMGTHSAMNPTRFISKWLSDCRDILKMKNEAAAATSSEATDHPRSLISETNHAGPNKTTMGVTGEQF